MSRAASRTLDGSRPIALGYDMPTICRFYGILIQMYFLDHNPPHFHALYDDQEAAIAIRDLSILEGDLPPKAIGMVMEWAKAHRAELMADWERAVAKQQLLR